MSQNLDVSQTWKRVKRSLQSLTRVDVALHSSFQLGCCARRRRRSAYDVSPLWITSPRKFLITKAQLKPEPSPGARQSASSSCTPRPMAARGTLAHGRLKGGPGQKKEKYGWRSNDGGVSVERWTPQTIHARQCFCSLLKFTFTSYASWILKNSFPLFQYPDARS